MGLLKRADARVRKGLSANAVRLLTREPEPSAPVRQAEKVLIPVERHQEATKSQLDRRLQRREKKRTARRRS